MTALRLLLLSALLLVTLVHGCSENPVDSGPPKIIGGERTEIMSQTVGAAGGRVAFDRPGDSLDGLAIDVPAGAYGEARTFRISTAKIERHELGADFNPLTPLITIENGGGYSNTPMTLTIPCTIPDGHFAMAFVYDRATGSLEGIPTVSMNDGSITVGLSNFSFSSIVAPAKSSTLQGGAVTIGESEVVVSSIPEAKLEEPSNSGFVPGVDDWQFPNYGSHVYIGHCAGMSSAMMWYYNARKIKRGDEPLYGRFDNDGARTTPEIWADDVSAYSFCGMAQIQIPWNTTGQWIQTTIEKKLPVGVTYNLFAYSIRLTKQPQFVWIIHEKGTDSGSHAMVIYKVDRGQIYIADPNYRGKTDRITEYSLGQILPYYTGPNAQNVGGKYTTFYYLAQSSIVNFDLFKSRWGDLVGGNGPREIFPSYSIHARASSNLMEPLSDGFTTESGVLEFDVHNLTNAVPLKVFAVYDADQKSVPINNGKTVSLRYGEQLLGFHVVDNENRWVGFEWVRVMSKEDATDPEPTPPSESSYDCSSFFMIDSVGQLSSHPSYSIYPDGTFNFTSGFYAGSLQMTIKSFNGVGTYPLFHQNTLGSHIFMNNGLAWYGGGTMTITRWDSEKVEGTFEFKAYEGTKLVKRVDGQFYCTR